MYTVQDTYTVLQLCASTSQMCSKISLTNLDSVQATTVQALTNFDSVHASRLLSVNKNLKVDCPLIPALKGQ